jgi:hypothetical protein
MTYKTKLEAYEAGKRDMAAQWETYFFEQKSALIQLGLQAGIAQEKARAKKKLDPHYNRPVSLKERADREAEQELGDEVEIEFVSKTVHGVRGPVTEWQGLGKTKQPSLWQRLTRPIIRELKGFFRP